jgi:hypothetical protein
MIGDSAPFLTEHPEQDRCHKDATTLRTENVIPSRPLDPLLHRR